MSPDAETEALLTPWQRAVIDGVLARCDANDIAWERALLRQFTRLGSEQVTVQLSIDDITIVVATDRVEVTAHSNPSKRFADADAAVVLARLTAWLDDA